MPIKYNYSDACSIFDYHERTGLFPKDMTESQFNILMATFNLTRDTEDFTDPAGGHGLESHI